jgi:putative peptidoglycan lipid II flippase
VAAGSHRIARAAALIAVLTLASRVAGFARTLVLGGTVGYTHLADVYQTANSIPNIVFEIVAGGVLAALVVPLLAGDLDRADKAAAGATASALLTWVLVVLVPVAVLVAALADPVMWLLAPGRSAAERGAGAGMLRVFAPQLPLYGVGIVLTGVLQAHRRFAWPVLAPLLSSLTVIGAYLTYGAVAPHQPDLPAVGAGPRMVLAAGTTLGVVVLSLCLVPPVRRLGLPWRPTLRLAPAPRRAVRGLVGVGVLTVAAQQLTTALTIALVNWRTGGGALVRFTQAQTVYLLPWAVLAVPVATSVYPALAGAAAAGDGDRFGRSLAGATRAVLLLSGLGAAGLAALAWPAAWVYARAAHQPAQASGLAAGIIAFAPGLLGYGLFALHSRALYASGHTRAAAQATVAGWGAVVALSVGLALSLPVAHRVPAVAAANSAGMLLLGVVLVIQVRRCHGAGALAGAGRAGGAALLAGTLSALAGIAVRAAVPPARGWVPVFGAALLSGAAAAVVFGGVAVLVDRPDAAALLARVRARVRARVIARRPARGEGGAG